ncbi:RagB/SusD family nutrient uptake outer membrane protein [Membranicola marinus]|uniref:RagB/SusD family nutrient uptake outer membrane protein n=1 Tax=Membranihabitans marinus TaxID=1227546 RepID=A0A953HVY5_9BACT|nr:RagB/SusD family nutrient uptake outer membrane protein [Membranihabitans marinus]MBY5959480.1 RagB/SusD family nutrient uptake outer membrane protein [Membranihabitans marinus]
MNKYIIFLSAIIFLFCGCELDERPVTSADKNAIFSSEDGLKAYSISFYDMFPSATSQAIVEQSLVDYGATNTLGGFILRNSYSENNSSGWNWSALRNVNYFIANCTSPAVSESVRNNYIGLARYFRAMFYYDKVRRFGDVPWVDRPLEPKDEEILYGSRDSRELVMEKVYEDLIFAAENITRSTDAAQSSLVTKWAAYALASRVALFEGTFRKYHNLNLPTSSEEWLIRAADAAKAVMEHSGKSLHDNYRELFTSDDPPSSETILAIASDASLNVKHGANWRWTSETFGTGLNLIRPYIATYLQKDGSPYTTRPGWEYEDFYEEFQDRDLRLHATLRHPGYTREGKRTLPVFGGYARLGYQPIKLSVDATVGDDKNESTHALQLIRYGEVLLNYAEAKAELGTLTDADWAMTIGALRARAGITGGLEMKPTTIDTYLQETYYPDISDPVILEIRRERATELIFEGFRFDDLRRWKRGDLFKMTWTGMYISDVNKPLDVDHDGVDDVIYYTDASGLESAEDQSNNPNLYRVQVSKDPGAEIIQVHEAGDGQGYYLAWYTNNESKKVWGPKQYFFPVPVGALNNNPNLEQNPGWENGATNDGN